MASNQYRYQLPPDTLVTYMGGNALTHAAQASIVPWLESGATAFANAYFGIGGPGAFNTSPSGTSVTIFTPANSGASGVAITTDYFGGSNVNMNGSPINTYEARAHQCTFFATSNSMPTTFSTSPRNVYPPFSPTTETQVGSYIELHQALTELHNLDDDDWKIQTPVYFASVQVAATLLEYDIPKPAVFTHGTKSVVFNWSGQDVDLYLTVSKNRLSVLVSSAEGIEYRTEFSADSGDDTNRFFAALGSVRFIAAPEAPVTATASDK